MHCMIPIKLYFRVCLWTQIRKHGINHIPYWFRNGQSPLFFCMGWVTTLDGRPSINVTHTLHPFRMFSQKLSINQLAAKGPGCEGPPRNGQRLQTKATARRYLQGYAESLGGFSSGLRLSFVVPEKTERALKELQLGDNESEVSLSGGSTTARRDSSTPSLNNYT